MRKFFATTGMGMLLIALGVPAALHAQDEQPPRHEEPNARPQEEPKHPQEARPQKHEQEPKPQKEERKPPKHDESPNGAMERPEQERHGQDRDRDHPEHERAGRPAGKSVRIPDEKFRAQFGRQHTVVIRQPVIVEGRPRFQFSGYWFVISDPWPADWSYADDCYIDYIDGEYYLFNVRHPGVRIVLFVTE